MFQSHNPSGRTMALGSTQPLTEMTTRCISWGRCVRLTILPPSCAVVVKSWNLNFLGPSGPLQVCNGTALPCYIRNEVCIHKWTDLDLARQRHWKLCRLNTDLCHHLVAIIVVNCCVLRQNVFIFRFKTVPKTHHKALNLFDFPSITFYWGGRWRNG